MRRVGRVTASGRRGPARRLGVLMWCGLLALVLTACTDAPSPAPAADPGATEAVPEIPQVDESADVTRPGPDGRSTPAASPSARPAPGEHVLVDLEGPITDRDATDVVLRTPQGMEVDRFRLPAAVDVHSQTDGRWALIETSDGRWGLLDAHGPSLSVVPFDAARPTGDPVIFGSLAWWDDPDDPWLLRLDSGEVRRLGDLVDEPASAVAVATDGEQVLLDGARTAVLDTGSWRVTPTVQTDRLAMADDGTVATVTTQDGQVILAVQAPGTDGRDLAILPGVGTPVPLPDGRVAVLGDSSVLVTPEGTASALPPVVVEGRAVASGDGRAVLAATAEGLVLVDTEAGSVTSAPGTAGLEPVDRPWGRWMWALSGSDQPGVAVVDVETGQTHVALDDVVTAALTSTGVAGEAAVVSTGESGSDAVLVLADGTATPLQSEGDVIRAVLSPDGATIAVAVVREGGRAVLVDRVDELLAGATGSTATIETGRQPAWLRTGQAGG